MTGLGPTCVSVPTSLAIDTEAVSCQRCSQPPLPPVPLFLAVLTSTLKAVVKFSFVNTRNQFWLFCRKGFYFRDVAEVAHEIARNVKNQAWQELGRAVIHQVRTPMLSLHEGTVCYWKLRQLPLPGMSPLFQLLHCLFWIPSPSGITCDWQSLLTWPHPHLQGVQWTSGVGGRSYHQES